MVQSTHICWAGGHTVQVLLETISALLKWGQGTGMINTTPPSLSIWELSGKSECKATLWRAWSKAWGNMLNIPRTRNLASEYYKSSSPALLCTPKLVLCPTSRTPPLSFFSVKIGAQQPQSHYQAAISSGASRLWVPCEEPQERSWVCTPLGSSLPASGPGTLCSWMSWMLILQTIKHQDIELLCWTSGPQLSHEPSLGDRRGHGLQSHFPHMSGF